MPAPRRLSILDIELLVRETGLGRGFDYYELEAGIGVAGVAAGGEPDSVFLALKQRILIYQQVTSE